MSSADSASTPDPLRLLLPEWQGSATEPSLSFAARALADRLYPNGFVEVEAPANEALPVEDGVAGLASIVARARHTRDLLQDRQPSRLFVIGGTCGVELAPVSYLNARYHADLAVLWLDAHADLNTPGTSPSGHFHGMVLRTLLGAGPAPLVELLPRPLTRDQVILGGARDLDRDEAAFVSDAPVARLRPADLLVPDRLSGVVRARGFRKIYIHLDLDVLDPAEFPHSLMQTPAGVSMNAVAETVADLANAFDVVGFSVVEFRPRGGDAVGQLVNWLRKLPVFDLRSPAR
ncbi:MAG TPA: arginase family protein [Vicinamibacterales bacterium]|nr:arginase family protein [Vicinamibacterales bacterium]